MKRLSGSENQKSNKDKSNSPELDTSQSMSSKSVPENLQDPKNVNQRKKKKHRFNEREIRSLIEAVKARPLLWTTSPQFDSVKRKAWEEICEELNIEEVTWSELKLKWNTLRYTFKQCTEKLVGHGASLHEVSWVHFKQLLFLYDADDEGGDEVNSEEMSYIKLEPEIEILDSPAVSKPGNQVSVQGDNQIIQATQPSISVPSPVTVEYNQSSICTSSQPRWSLEFSESNTAYCNHLLTELQSLSTVRSRHLRRLLVKKLHDYIDYQR